MISLNSFLGFSLAALGILAIIGLHSHSQGRPTDKNSRLFHKIYWLAILDISFDILATALPDLSIIHNAFVFSFVNAVYFQLNAFMCYNILIYADSIRECAVKMSATGRRIAAIPGMIVAALLILNFPFKIVFSFDTAGNYNHGPLYYCIYILAMGYIAASIVLLIVKWRQYNRRKRYFMMQTFLALIILISLQWIYPKYMLIDLGIAIAILLFYLHNNNPVQYQDALTGAFDKRYFESWVSEEVQNGGKLFMIAVYVANYSEIISVYGESVGNGLMVDLAEQMKKIDDAGGAFRVSDSSMLIHFHNGGIFESNIAELKNNIEKYALESKYGKAKIRIAGIANVEKLAAEYSIYSYFKYLFEKAQPQSKLTLIIGNDDNLEGFKYEMEVERFLREAIEKDNFDIAYQPIFNLKKKRFTEVEVLSRLIHPEFGPVDPQHFINLAERDGIIADITYLQFRKTCSFFSEHRKLFDKLDKVKFNLSPMDFAEDRYVNRLIKVIDENELSREKFSFEITESVATEYSDVLIENVDKIISSGITLSLDDFGSGYANLSSIVKLPFESVKIDRSLVLEIFSSSSHAELYKGIMAALKNCGMKIICEGIESLEESMQLESWGADLIQGYYYSRPLTGEQLSGEFDEIQS